MMRKALLAVCLLFIAVFVLSAAEADVTWVWFENDPAVQYYRYQVDGEEDDNWTVVDFFINEVTITLDVSEPHTLYLQQSYDGINWSVSSFTESDVYSDFEDTGEDYSGFFDESSEPDVTDNPEDDDIVIAAEVIEDDVYLPGDAVETYDSLVWLDIGLGYMNSIPDSAGPTAVGLNLGYSRTFMKAGLFDIGWRADLGVYTSDNLFNFRQWAGGQWKEDWELQAYVNCKVLATTVVGNCDLYGAIGPDFSCTFATAENNRSALVGLALELGVRYHRFGKTAICFAVSDHQYLFSVSGNGLETANRLELKVSLGRSF